MIELLNTYLSAKKQSESAARELGLALGQTFEASYRDNNDVRRVNPDQFASARDLTLLQLKYDVGGLLVFDEAFGEMIKSVPGTKKYTVGVGVPRGSKLNREGMEVELHEESFVRGFIEGFRKSRSSTSRQQNGVSLSAN